MKLNKTEQALLAEAERSPYKQVGVDHGLQGPSGRKRSFGKRRQRAACSLRDKGLLVRVHSDGGTPLYKNGWGQNGVVYSATWRLASAMKEGEKSA